MALYKVMMKTSLRRQQTSYINVLNAILQEQIRLHMGNEYLKQTFQQACCEGRKDLLWQLQQHFYVWAVSGQRLRSLEQSLYWKHFKHCMSCF